MRKDRNTDRTRWNQGWAMDEGVGEECKGDECSGWGNSSWGNPQVAVRTSGQSTSGRSSSKLTNESKAPPTSKGATEVTEQEGFWGLATVAERFGKKLISCRESLHLYTISLTWITRNLLNLKNIMVHRNFTDITRILIEFFALDRPLDRGIS